MLPTIRRTLGLHSSTGTHAGYSVVKAYGICDKFFASLENWESVVGES